MTFSCFDLRYVCFLLFRFLIQKRLNILLPDLLLLLENPTRQERCRSRSPAPQDFRCVSSQGGQGTFSQWQSIKPILTPSRVLLWRPLCPAPGFDCVLVRCFNIMYVIQISTVKRSAPGSPLQIHPTPHTSPPAKCPDNKLIVVLIHRTVAR